MGAVASREQGAVIDAARRVSVIVVRALRRAERKGTSFVDEAMRMHAAADARADGALTDLMVREAYLERLRRMEAEVRRDAIYRREDEAPRYAYDRDAAQRQDERASDIARRASEMRSESIMDAWVQDGKPMRDWTLDDVDRIVARNAGQMSTLRVNNRFLAGWLRPRYRGDRAKTAAQVATREEAQRAYVKYRDA